MQNSEEKRKVYTYAIAKDNIRVTHTFFEDSIFFLQKLLWLLCESDIETNYACACARTLKESASFRNFTAAVDIVPLKNKFEFSHRLFRYFTALGAEE